MATIGTFTKSSDGSGFVGTIKTVVLNVKAKIDWQDWQPGEMRRTWANIEKPQRLLGYAPRTDFDTGLRRFAAWLQERLRLEGSRG